MTEDDAYGGTDAVLVLALKEFGLPPDAGLTGLLRHLQGNRVMTETLLQRHIELLQNRISAFMDAVRRMKEDGTIVDLFMVAEMVEGLQEETVVDMRPPMETVDLDGYVEQRAAPESLHKDVADALRTRGKYAGQYDEDHRHVPKPDGQDG